MQGVINKWQRSNNSNQKQRTEVLQNVLQQWDIIKQGCENTDHMPDAEAALQRIYPFAPEQYGHAPNPRPYQMLWAAVNTLFSILKRFIFNERKVVWATERNEAIRQ
eukprot:3934973-Rhodomonas_salina.1